VRQATGSRLLRRLIGTRSGGADRVRLDAVPAGERPFDATTMLDGDDTGDGVCEDAAVGRPDEAARV
jgi:hypothetical protein